MREMGIYSERADDDPYADYELLQLLTRKNTIIPRKNFMELVKQISREYNKEYVWDKLAIEALHGMAEIELSLFFEKVVNATYHAKRVTTTPDDVELYKVMTGNYIAESAASNEAAKWVAKKCRRNQEELQEGERAWNDELNKKRGDETDDDGDSGDEEEYAACEEVAVDNEDAETTDDDVSVVSNWTVQSSDLESLSEPEFESDDEDTSESECSDSNSGESTETSSDSGSDSTERSESEASSNVSAQEKAGGKRKRGSD